MGEGRSCPPPGFPTQKAFMAAGGRGGRRLSSRALGVLVTGGALGVMGLGGIGTETEDNQVAAALPRAAYAPPPANAGFDYQIGEPYGPPSGVGVISRDHSASPAAGNYNICYVNGFQAQTEAAGWGKGNHDDLLLKRDGKYV